jgi:cation diffusion facilitator family transporter
MRKALARIPGVEARAVLLSVGVGALLMGIKFTAYFLTGSAAVFSDAIESIVNVMASLMAGYALFLAHQPPDKGHPYGHGKVEFLAAGIEGGMVLLGAVVIAVKTVDALLLDSLDLRELGVGLILIGCAMVINGIVGGWLIRTGRRQSSLTLEADGWHLVSDAITSAAVIVALAIVKWTGWRYADPIISLLIAAYVAWTGLRVLRRSWAGLMDEQDAEDERMLAGILESHMGPKGAEPRICSFHKLRHRHSGRYHWVDFHIMVPAALSVEQGHRIASAIEWEIEQKLGEGNATAHVEPCGNDSCSYSCCSGRS